MPEREGRLTKTLLPFENSHAIPECQVQVQASSAFQVRANAHPEKQQVMASVLHVWDARSAPASAVAGIGELKDKIYLSVFIYLVFMINFNLFESQSYRMRTRREKPSICWFTLSKAANTGWARPSQKSRTLQDWHMGSGSQALGISVPQSRYRWTALEVICLIAGWWTCACCWIITLFYNMRENSWGKGSCECRSRDSLILCNYIMKNKKKKEIVKHLWLQMIPLWDDCKEGVRLACYATTLAPQIYK